MVSSLFRAANHNQQCAIRLVFYFVFFSTQLHQKQQQKTFKDMNRVGTFSAESASVHTLLISWELT